MPQQTPNIGLVTSEYGEDYINANFELIDTSLADKANQSDLNGRGINLSNYANLANGNDWTSALQKAIDDGNPSIYISSPISISTVTIPPNRPIKIYTNKYINIYGTPLITILTGGSGIKFNGAGASLCTGAILEGLSFTSNGVSVNSAIMSSQLSGFFFKDLYFSNVKGSAIQGTGTFQDGGLDNIQMLDCGDVNLPVFQVGDASNDANRISTRNLRIERANGLMLDIRGTAYAIEFQDTKLHGPSSLGLLSTASGTYGIRFNGGQFHVSQSSDTISLNGIGNKIDGVTFTSQGSPTDITGAVSMSGQGNKINNCTFNNLYGKVVNITGESQEFVNNMLYSCGYLTSSAPFAQINFNRWIAASATTTQTACLINATNVGVSIIGNKSKNSQALDRFITANSGKGAIVRDNYDFGSAYAHMVGTNMTTSLFDNNNGTAITASIVFDTSVGGTNTLTNNKLIS